MGGLTAPDHSPGQLPAPPSGGAGGAGGVGGVGEEILLARAFLSRVAEPGRLAVWSLVREHGPLEAVRMIRAGTADEGAVRATAGRLATTDPGADLDTARRRGIRLVVPESDEWPHFAFSALERTGLARLQRHSAGETTRPESGDPVPPIALWVRGAADLAALGVRSVAIVGARSATRYGEQVAADLAHGLARRGFAVVSGGAYGIDAAAHRGALSADGVTVVVSAGGLDRAYPSAHETLFRRAAKRGLLISESPPGAAPQRGRFLTRNRVIAALSTGCVVVEAARRSGALNTARHARDLGRPLMIVPGPVTSPMSAGCHAELRTGDSLLVTCVDDVLDVIGSSSDLPAEVVRGGVAPADLRARLDLLDDVARRVHDGLPARQVATVEVLAAGAGLPVLEVIRALPALELAGLVRVDGDGVRRCVGAAP